MWRLQYRLAIFRVRYIYFPVISSCRNGFGCTSKQYTQYSTIMYVHYIHNGLSKLSGYVFFYLLLKRFESELWNHSHLRLFYWKERYTIFLVWGVCVFVYMKRRGSTTFGYQMQTECHSGIQIQSEYKQVDRLNAPK